MKDNISDFPGYYVTVDGKYIPERIIDMVI